MKRPDKIIKYFPIQCEKEEIWVDYNGKPSYHYFIKIPYWIARAYRFYHGMRLKIEICVDKKSFKEQREEENHQDYERYFKENWAKKITKMRKLNNNYTMVAHGGKGIGWFKSIDDYNNYHKELDIINEKYGIKIPILTKSKVK